MHRILKFSFALWIALAALIVNEMSNRGFAQDKVYQKSGATLTGEIASLNRNEIGITVRGKKQVVPIDDVQRVLFNEEPSGMTRAKELVLTNQYDQAEEELKRVDTGSIKNESLQQDYIYYRAYIASQLALAGKGNAGSAAGAMLGYAKANPNSYHYYELCETVGGLAVASNSYPEAIRYYEAIDAAPFPAFKLKSDYLVGTAYLSEKKIPEAKSEFGKVVLAAATDPLSQRYQKLARVAVIRCDIVSGDPKSAVEQLLKMVIDSDNTDVPLFGNIYNTLGDAHMAAAQLEDAKLAYLHTDQLFSGNAENHAEALYQLSQLWEKTGNPQRAIEAKARLKQRYASSTWARK